MKEISHLIAEFKEALIRGLVPPLDMSLIIFEMDRSLKYDFDEVFTHMSMDLEDAACDIFIAIQNSKESE
jgi:hypothetical protein